MRTEQIDPRYVELDSWSASEMIAAMYEGQLEAATAVRGALGAIAKAVDDAVPALQRGGRIVYVGAGTSGRIGVQDGAELTPTFDWPADRVVFAMAGGLNALTRSAEEAEDNESAGARTMADAKVGANDVVNPDARDNSSSPIAGMPILEVDRAKAVVVLKRGSGKGFSGLENPLFTKQNCAMLYGDAKESLTQLAQNVLKA